MKKKRYKPLYKQFLHINRNIQNKYKLFKFKKMKWKRFQFHSQKQLKFFKRFRIKDQYQLTVKRFSGRKNAFRKKFKHKLLERKTLKLFYGNLKRRYVKRLAEKAFSSKYVEASFLNQLESRLDVVLYRSKFASSIRGAQQLILHNHVRVNKLTVCSQQHCLKPGDLIEITNKQNIRKYVAYNLDTSNFWPIPPRTMQINYKTLQIVFCSKHDENSIPFFNHYLNVGSVLSNMKKT